jgi:hypothetical protein
MAARAARGHGLSVDVGRRGSERFGHSDHHAYAHPHAERVERGRKSDVGELCVRLRLSASLARHVEPGSRRPNFRRPNFRRPNFRRPDLSRPGRVHIGHPERLGVRRLDAPGIGRAQCLPVSHPEPVGLPERLAFSKRVPLRLTQRLGVAITDRVDVPQRDHHSHRVALDHSRGHHPQRSDRGHRHRRRLVDQGFLVHAGQ